MDEGDPIQSKVPRLDDKLSRGEFKSDTVRLLSSIHHVVDPKENFGIINHLLNTFINHWLSLQCDWFSKL